MYFWLPDNTYSIYLKVGGKLYASESVTVTSGGSSAAEQTITIFDETKLRDALASGGTYYLPTDFNGQAGGLPVLTTELEFNGGHCILDLNGHELKIEVSSGNGIDIRGNGKLIIRDSSISSTGKLHVNNAMTSSEGGSGAGIKTTSGTLVIQSGTVIANGGSGGAGIGGGMNAASGGEVTISGGTVIANGGSGGAGIGGGLNGDYGSRVTISGGTVTANGGSGSAGMGGGNGGSAGGSLTIDGGSVKANNMEMDNAAKPEGSGSTPLYLTALTIMGSSPVANTALDDTGHGITIGSTRYDYGTKDVKTDENGKVYFYLPAGACSVALRAGGKLYGSNHVEVKPDNSGADALTPAKALISITQPAAITGLPSGTEKTAGAMGLPAYVPLVTDDGSVSGTVTWDVASCSYDPASKTEQTFTVNGTVTLPNDVANPNSVSLNVSVSVTANAKMYTLTAITPPAPVTGVANGVEKTASALGLPAHVTLVTDDGNVSGSVTWDVNSCAYDPASTTEQTFTVNGTVTLPGSVLNPNGVSLNVPVSVTVNAAAAPSAPSSAGPVYTTHTLTDTPTGLSVSGAFSRKASLRVNSFTPARNTTDPALAAIVKRMDNLEDTLIFCADITVSGNYSGPLVLSFKVGEQYNGQTVTLLHAKNGKLLTYTAVVKNGIATFTVDSLSPFALFAPVTEMDAIGIPKTGDGMRYAAIAVLGMVALVIGAVVRTWRQYKKD